MRTLFLRSSLIVRIKKQPSMAALSTKLALAACGMCLLAACAEQPARQMPPPAPVAATVPAPVPQIAPAAPAPPAPPPPDAWSRLRASFALDDCTLNPRAVTWARRFADDPQRFETQLREALPLLLYVQDAAEQAGVPGEFVLLPMIESRYEPGEPGRNADDPAGMWQIMPQTAHAFGLTITHGYDGRLDPVASTATVMKMLQAFHDDLHDWRLVDMAFNTGEYRVLGLLDGRDPPAADKPVNLPVGGITRAHLARLLAMACIIRDPGRFDVQLPQPDSDRQLALVQLPQAAELASAAKLAHMPLAKLRALNPGYRGKQMPADAPHHLLLPQPNADALLAAVSAGNGDMLAATDTSGTRHMHHHKPPRHRVLSGESLLSIARRYHLDADSLRKWNGLARNDDIHPGMTLLLTAPE
jgi:membrane-bound lytic murein transglycosylase D